MSGPRVGSQVRRVLSGAASAATSGLGLLLVAIGTVTMPSLLPLWAVIGAVIGGCRYTLMLVRAPSGRPPALDTLRRAGALSGLLATGTCLLLVGLVSVLGAGAGPVFLFLVLLLASMPRTWRAVAGLAAELVGRGPTSAVEASPVPVVPVPHTDTDTVTVTELSTPALCLAWRRSYLVLIDTPDGPARQDLAAARRQMLDELERRDGAGFASWMAAGARAGSDPARYLTPKR